MTDSTLPNLKLPEGWYVQLEGDKWDLEDWEYSLNEPFDPVVLRESNGSFVLKSDDFGEATTAAEVREKAIAVVNRLNGALALMHDSTPARVGSIIRVDGGGARHATVFAEAAGIAVGRVRARATATVLGPDRLPFPPPPPQPSDAQRWNEMAAASDDVADLLEQLGKATDWYEVYKTIELAERLAGGEHRLKTLLGSSSSDCKNLKQTANFYRHARAPRPAKPTTFPEGKDLLHYMVRQALASLA